MQFFVTRLCLLVGGSTIIILKIKICSQGMNAITGLFLSVMQDTIYLSSANSPNWLKLYPLT